MTLGRLDKRLVEEEQEIIYYKRLLRRNPDKALLWDFLAEAYYKMAEYDEAIQCWHKYLEKKLMDDHKILVKIAQAYEAKGEVEFAFHYYLQALKDHPEDTHLLGKFGEMAYETKNYYDALEAFQKLLKLGQKNEVILHNLGLTHYHLGHHKKALDYLQESLEINEDGADTWYTLAIIHAENYLIDDALIALEKAIMLNEDLKEKAKNDPAFQCITHLSIFELLTQSKVVEEEEG
ncbi:MAG: tetratricopeptide repeat protein [Candidatus Heimdallarchaeota archaeon]|nr:tetratricopeptide repeat protein [Candidatus Heimdallarchaeota archaeon]